MVSETGRGEFGLLTQEQLNATAAGFIARNEFGNFERLWDYAVYFLATEETQATVLVPLLPSTEATAFPHREWLNYMGMYAKATITMLTDDERKIAVWQQTARPILKALLRADKTWYKIHETYLDVIERLWVTLYREWSWAAWNPSRVTILHAIQSAATQDNITVNWRWLWSRVLKDRDRADPLIRKTFEEFIYTPQELTIVAAQHAAQAAHEARVEAKPYQTYRHQAQDLIGAMMTTSATELKQQLREYSNDYVELLGGFVFPRVTIRTQSKALPYLPSVEALMVSKNLRDTISRISYVGQLLVPFFLSPTYQTKYLSTGENLQRFMHFGDELLQYFIRARALSVMDENPEKMMFESPNSGIGFAVTKALTQMMRIVLSVRHDDSLVHSSFYDALFFWMITNGNIVLRTLPFYQPSILPPSTVNLASLRGGITSRLMGYYEGSKSKEEQTTYYPQLSAIVEPAWEAAEAKRIEDEQIAARLAVEQGRLRAAAAVTSRLRSRRRLSLSFPPPSSSSSSSLASAAAAAASSFAALPPRKRRPSSHSIVTAASSSADIRQFLQQQEATEAELLSQVPLVSPAVRQWARRRSIVRANLATRHGLAREDEEKIQEELRSQVPLATRQNCMDFATRRCSNPTNLAGTHWCNVSENYWWGPIGNGRNCYDIRELLKHFAEQAIDIQSIPRPSQPFSYPNKVPIRENQVRAMMEIARVHNHPVPWELQTYFVGKEIQREGPTELLGGFRKTKLIRARPPYAAVATALERQEKYIAHQIRRGYAGFPEEKEEESEEEEEAGETLDTVDISSDEDEPPPRGEVDFPVVPLPLSSGSSSSSSYSSSSSSSSSVV